jgi:hypothetical protein
MHRRKTTDTIEMRVQIYPRRKAGQKKRDLDTAVVVTPEVLQGMLVLSSCTFLRQGCKFIEKPGFS